MPTQLADQAFSSVGWWCMGSLKPSPHECELESTLKANYANSH